MPCSHVPRLVHPDCAADFPSASINAQCSATVQRYNMIYQQQCSASEHAYVHARDRPRLSCTRTRFSLARPETIAKASNAARLRPEPELRVPNHATGRSTRFQVIPPGLDFSRLRRRWWRRRLLRTPRPRRARHSSDQSGGIRLHLRPRYIPKRSLVAFAKTTQVLLHRP